LLRSESIQSRHHTTKTIEKTTKQYILNTGLIINRKLTDNTMLKIERTKAQTQMYKVLNRQLNLEPCKSHIKLRVSRVCRYQRGNYNPHIEEEQTRPKPLKKQQNNIY
jgi:hypothetical protein